MSEQQASKTIRFSEYLARHVLAKLPPSKVVLETTEDCLTADELLERIMDHDPECLRWANRQLYAHRDSFCQAAVAGACAQASEDELQLARYIRKQTFVDALGHPSCQKDAVFWTKDEGVVSADTLVNALENDEDLGYAYMAAVVHNIRQSLAM